MPFNSPMSSPVRSRVTNHRTSVQYRTNSLYSPQNRATRVARSFQDVFRPSMKLIDTENDWLQSPLEKLNPDKIHWFTNEEEMERYRVYVGVDGVKKYIVNANLQKITMHRGIFIVSTSGKMYLAEDRKSSKATDFMDGSVLCHISFGAATDILHKEQVIFPGLLSVVNGVVQEISNESGTYKPSIPHTIQAREVLQHLLEIREPIDINLIMLEELVVENITQTLAAGHFDIVARIIDNLTQQKNIVLAEQLCELMHSAKEQYNQQAQERSQELSDTIECAICTERMKNTILMPCRHMAACELCSRALDICPICRSHISQKITAFV